MKKRVQETDSLGFMAASILDRIDKLHVAAWRNKHRSRLKSSWGKARNGKMTTCIINLRVESWDTLDIGITEAGPVV